MKIGFWSMTVFDEVNWLLVSWLVSIFSQLVMTPFFNATNRYFPSTAVTFAYYPNFGKEYFKRFCIQAYKNYF